MKLLVSRKYVRAVSFGLALLVIPASIQLERVAFANTNQVKPMVTKSDFVDLRAARLKQYFASMRCPIRELASDFIEAADDNHLDWRLLPSISMIESGGGKAFRNNNIFGWNNCDTAFPTIRAGIRQVAFKLGRLPIYRNRGSHDKLRLYNPYSWYPGRVERVMDAISPTADLRHARPQPIVLAELGE